MIGHGAVEKLLVTPCVESPEPCSTGAGGWYTDFDILNTVTSFVLPLLIPYLINMFSKINLLGI